MQVARRSPQEIEDIAAENRATLGGGEAGAHWGQPCSRILRYGVYSSLSLGVNPEWTPPTARR